MSHIDIPSTSKSCISILGIFSCLYMIIKLCALVNDLIFDHSTQQEQRILGDDAKFWSLMLSGYVVVMMSIRLCSMEWLRVIYELLWACNVAMYVAAYGLWTDRPHLVSAAAMSISIDQVMWYVDVCGFGITHILSKYNDEGESKQGGKWLIGVAKYLVWPETTWSRRLTSGHHMWFMPLCMYTVGIPVKQCSSHLPEFSQSTPYISLQLLSWSTVSNFTIDFVLSCVLVLSIAIAARLLTPFTVKFEESKQPVYLNVNLAYEVWPDVTISVLQCGSPRAVIHIPRLCCIWGSLNLGCSLILAIISIIVDPFSGVLPQAQCRT